MPDPESHTSSEGEPVDTKGDPSGTSEEDPDRKDPDVDPTTDDARYADLQRRQNDAVRELLRKYGEEIKRALSVNMNPDIKLKDRALWVGTPDWLHALATQAADALQKLKSFTGELAAETGGTVHDVTVASPEDAEEKVRDMYWRPLLPYVLSTRQYLGDKLPATAHATVVFEDIDTIYQALAAIDRLQSGSDVEQGVEVVSLSDGYEVPDADGKRGISLLIYFGPEFAHMASVRLSLASMEVYLESQGETARETVKTIEAAADASPEKSFTPQQAQTIGELKRQNEMAMMQLFLDDRDKAQKSFR